jgi:hypothetical protein
VAHRFLGRRGIFAPLQSRRTSARKLANTSHGPTKNRVIEDIAQPARAPAAPAAELTSVLSAPPFGVLSPRVGGSSPARVVSGYSPLAEPD